MASMDMGLVPTTPHSQSSLFPMPSTITHLQHKWVRDIEFSVRKTYPLPTKLFEPSTDEDFYGGCLIIEENRENLDPASMT